MKLGKRASRASDKALMLAGYTPAYVPFPVSADWSVGAGEFGPMGNLDIGDCTAAACGHAVQVWTRGAKIPSDADVIALYSAASGYKPGNELTDNGAVIVDVLAKWGSIGLGSDKIDAYAAIDATDLDNIKRAVALLGCADIGLEMPMSAQTQSAWDVVDNDGGAWGGHSVLIVGYDTDGVTVISWGRLIHASWDFLARYMDEAFGLVSRDWLTATGVTPSQLDFDQMVKDMATIRVA